MRLNKYVKSKKEKILSKNRYKTKALRQHSFLSSTHVNKILKKIKG